MDQLLYVLQTVLTVLFSIILSLVILVLGFVFLVAKMVNSSVDDQMEKDKRHKKWLVKRHNEVRQQISEKVSEVVGTIKFARSQEIAIGSLIDGLCNLLLHGNMQRHESYYPTIRCEGECFSLGNVQIFFEFLDEIISQYDLPNELFSVSCSIIMDGAKSIQTKEEVCKFMKKHDL